MAVLRLKNLRFKALHGHLPEEKIIGNTFEVDVEVMFDLPTSDHLDDAPDYSKMAKLVEKVMFGESVNLIETLIQRLGKTIGDHFNTIQSWTVTLRKLRPPMNPTCDFTEIRETWTRS